MNNNEVTSRVIRRKRFAFHGGNMRISRLYVARSKNKFWFFSKSACMYLMQKICHDNFFFLIKLSSHEESTNTCRSTRDFKKRGRLRRMI